MKIAVALAFVAIVASLGFALRSMMRGDSAGDDHRRSRRMARALAVRVGLSVLLFTLLIFSHWMGWIQPTGLPLR
jgi:hypothetical protein